MVPEMFGFNFDPTPTCLQIPPENMKKWVQEIREAIAAMSDEQVLALWVLQHPVRIMIQKPEELEKPAKEGQSSG